jgi:hypothetical protein
MRLSCGADMPFFDALIRCSAISHLLTGLCEASKIVPTFTVSFFRHCEHFHRHFWTRVLVVAFGVRR